MAQETGAQRPPRAARLRLEALERRENPAANVWQPASPYYSYFYTSANWSDGTPTADDVLVFDGDVTGIGCAFPSASGQQSRWR